DAVVTYLSGAKQTAIDYVLSSFNGTKQTADNAAGNITAVNQTVSNLAGNLSGNYTAWTANDTSLWNRVTTVNTTATHSNRTVLDNISAAFTTAYETSYNAVVSWLTAARQAYVDYIPTLNSTVNNLAENLSGNWSSRGQANGIASLNGSALVPAAQLGTGTANSSTFLTGAGQFVTAGVNGTAGLNGTNGTNGTNGLNGTNGTNGIMDFANFYALMPCDNAVTIAVGAAVLFPQNGATNSVIVRDGGANSSSTFVLPAIGTYQVMFQVSVDEPGQLVLGLDAGLGVVEQAYSVVGRATATSQIVGMSLVTTTVADSKLSVRNPTGNAAALTITPIAGGTHAVSANIIIMRIY
ncbi:MAG: hypothetical protein Q7J73_07730, partial [Dehalococcoidales bacterium]|nr:hypothetical protein [Dehalococcoidales bacterium]